MNAGKTNLLSQHTRTTARLVLQSIAWNFI
jgi:hypothetical protein